MKAAVYDRPGPPDIFRIVDLPDPVAGKGEILIAVEAISIEGGDLINRRVALPPHENYVVGYAAAGTVIAVGEGVTQRKPGDRVATFDLAGSHADRRVVPVGRTWLVPDGVHIAEAAILPIAFGTAHHCIHARAGLKEGETTLIMAAAGGVGVAAIQLAKKAGGTVLAVASGVGRQDRLKALGADHVIDRREQDVVSEVRRITGGKGADVAIDPVGTTLAQSLNALAPNGRLVFVGNAGGGDLSVDLWPAMQANQSLLGVFMGTRLENPDVRATIDEMLAAVADGNIKVLMEKEFPLSEVARAHAFAETAKPLGRVVMRP